MIPVTEHDLVHALLAGGGEEGADPDAVYAEVRVTLLAELMASVYTYQRPSYRPASGPIETGCAR